MKKIFPLICLLCIILPLWGQDNVGIGTTNPNPRALLDLMSSDKGLLVPRMNTVQRLAIAPAGIADEGLLVYDTNVQRFFFWDGTQWVEMPSPSDGDWIIAGNNMFSGVPGNVGIGTAVPTARLHTLGTVRLEGLPMSSSNDVVVADPSGDIGIRTLTPDIWDGDDVIDADPDPTNEIQTLSAIGNTVSISGGNTVAIDVDDADPDPTNEFNTLLNFDSLTMVLSLTDPGGTLSTPIGINVNDADSDPTNELNLSLNYDSATMVLSLTDAGGTLSAPLGINTNDADSDPTNELNSSISFNPATNQLTITDAGGSLTTTILDAEAENGLYYDPVDDAIKLGGPLTENSTISLSNFQLDWDLTGTGDFEVKNAGNPAFAVSTDGSVGIGSNVTDPSAIWEVNSTTRGMLFPSMTTVQRNAIPAPAVGLTLFNITTATHQYWNGNCWLNVGDAVCTDFVISVAPVQGCVATSTASSDTISVTVTLVSGNAVPVLLGVSGVPSGVNVDFSSNPVVPSQTVTATITGSPAAVPGIYNLNFMAIYGSNIQIQPFTLEVVGFTYGISSTAATIQEINVPPNTNLASTTISVSYTNTCGSAGGSAMLSVSGVPSGVTANFSVNPITNNPGTSVLTFSGSSCAEPGIYNLTITTNVSGTVFNTPYVLTISPSQLNITANTNNYNLYAAAGTPPCDIDLTCTVAAGVTVGSTSGTQASFSTGNFPSGSIIILENNGSIIGKGGNGGTTAANCTNKNGQAGGNALALNMMGLTIINNGDIFGGGGGGGAGEDLSVLSPCTDHRSGGGGGGGAGATGGTGGAAGPAGCGNGGQNGGITGGLGGSVCTKNCTILFFSFSDDSGAGGNGGNYGMAGQNGNNATFFTTSILSGECIPEGNGGGPGGWLKTNGNTYIITTPGNTAGPIVP